MGPQDLPASESGVEGVEGFGMRYLQISETDLSELEHLMPELMRANAVAQNPREKTQWRRVQKILCDVRWNYGPWLECDRVATGDDDTPLEPSGAKI